MRLLDVNVWLAAAWEKYMSWQNIRLLVNVVMVIVGLVSIGRCLRDPRLRQFVSGFTFLTTGFVGELVRQLFMFPRTFADSTLKVLDLCLALGGGYLVVSRWRRAGSIQ